MSNKERKIKKQALTEEEMPFLSHLEELRTRLIKIVIVLSIGMVVCLIFSDYILAWLQKPSQTLEVPLHFQFLKVQGMFLLKLEIAFFGGMGFALPFVIYQVWSFISPGLLPNEQKYFIPLIFFSSILFFTGVSFAFYLILPLALNFFIVGLSVEGIDAQITINYYISFVLQLIFLFGAVFELPVISYFFAKIGLLTADFMRVYRRHAIIVIFVVAAFFTPPDPLTQIFLGIPLILLYEASIFIVVWVEKGNKKRALAAQKQSLTKEH